MSEKISKEKQAKLDALHEQFKVRILSVPEKKGPHRCLDGGQVSTFDEIYKWYQEEQRVILDSDD